jgi:hypothetical protein
MEDYTDIARRRKLREAILTENRNRQKRRRRKGQRPPIAPFRVAELERLYFVRYRGDLIPDDDDGRDSVLILLNHLAMLGRPDVRIHDWLARRAPWFDDQDMIAKILKRPITWKADTLGKRLNLMHAERTRLKIKTIGAVDCPKDKRTTDRAAKNRLAMQAKRRSNGVIARADFLAQSLTRLKPWKDEGIGRRQWYRNRGTGVHGTGVCTVYLPHLTAHGPVTSQEERTDAGTPGALRPSGCEGITPTDSPLSVVAVHGPVSAVEGMDGKGVGLKNGRAISTNDRVSWDDLRRLKAEAATLQARRIDHLITIERKDDEGAELIAYDVIARPSCPTRSPHHRRAFATMRRVLEHFGEPRMWLRLLAAPRRRAVFAASVTAVP